MDSTRQTTDMIDRHTLKDAYDAYLHGTDTGRLAAQLSVYPVDLQRCFDEMTAEREKRRQQPQGNTITALTDKLFTQLDRLEAVDVSDHEMLKAEVERSRAVDDIAKTIIDSAGTMLTAARLSAELNKVAVELPHLLEG